MNKLALNPIKKFPHWLCGISCVILGGELFAAPAWNINFENMTAGQPIEVAPYEKDKVNTKPQKMEASQGHATEAANSIIVRKDFKAGEASLPGHSAVLCKTGNAKEKNVAEFRMIGHPSDYSSHSGYLVSFDILLSDSAWRSATSLNVRLINQDNESQVGSIVFCQQGEIFINSDLTDDSLRVPEAWKAEKIHRIQMRIDEGSRRFEVRMDGKPIGSLPLNTDQDIGIHRIRFRANSDAASFPEGIGIDNIEAAAGAQ